MVCWTQVPLVLLQTTDVRQKEDVKVAQLKDPSGTNTCHYWGRLWLQVQVCHYQRDDSTQVTQTNTLKWNGHIQDAANGQKQQQPLIKDSNKEKPFLIYKCTSLGEKENKIAEKVCW